MGLLDELLMAQTKKRNLMMQGTSPRVGGQLTQMIARPTQVPLREQFPTVYGALGGLLGMEPDSMEGSILDPNTAAVRQGAGYGYPAGLALQALPMAAPAVSGAKQVGKFVAPKAGQLAENYMRGMGTMPGIVPSTNKNINVALNESSNFLSAKSDFGQVGGTIRPPDRFSDKPYLQINYAEVEKASRGSGKGKELYQSLINEAQARGLRVFSDSTVEKQAVNVYKSLGKKDYELRDMTSGSLEDGAVYGVGAKNPAFEILPRKSPYPQQAALDLAQQRAALPVEQGGLGLAAGNTADQRAGAMLAEDVYHGTNAEKQILNDLNFNLDADQRNVGGIWTTKDKNYASWLADQKDKDSASVMSLKLLNAKNSNEYDILQEGIKLADEIGVPTPKNALEAQELLAGGYGWDRVISDLLSQSKAPNLKITNFNDAYHSNPNEVTTAFITKDPSLFRLPNAAFDPFRRSAAIAATMGVAAPDLLAADLNEEELRKQMQSYGLLY